jgi:1-deoxy-D-xylulose-5-phosphate synthase
MRFVKPLDEKILHHIFHSFKKVVTVEDGTITGGFGSAVSEFLVNGNYPCQLKTLGIPDRFIEHGSLEQLYKDCGIDAEGILHSAIDFLER